MARKNGKSSWKELTEHKKEEERNKFLKAIEITKEAINITTPGTVMIYTNNAMDELFGYKKGELIGKHVSILNIGSPTKTRKVPKQISNAIKKNGVWEGEIHNKRKDGTEFISLAKITALTDKNGKIINYVSTQHDITEKKKAEKALKESEEKFRSLIESSSSVYDVVTPDGTVLYASPSITRVYGWKPENILDKSIFEHVHPDDIEHSMKKFKMLLKNPRKVDTAELRYRHKDGSWRNIEVSGINMINNPAINGIVLTSHDITKRKKLELQKQRLQNKLKQYAKRLENKVKKLEKDKINLTEKEKLVLWGITRYPDAHDKYLSKKLKLKRSTITAIRNRLREKEMYFVLNVPNLKALGAGLITFAYGRFNIPFEKRKEIAEKEGIIPMFNYYLATEHEFISSVVSKNMAEFEKNMSFAMSKANKYNILKNYQIAHFLFELSKIYKFLNYSDLLKHLFKIKIQEKAEEEEEEERELSKNEKRILLKLIEYPELSAYDLSFKVDLTRATVAKIKKRLIKEKFIQTTVIPNITKLGAELMILSHIKQETCLPKDAIKCMLEKNPHIVSLIGGDREAVGISCFKDYHEYTEFMKKNHLYGKEMLSEKPVMFKLLTKNIKSRRFDFLDVTKRLLGE